MASREAGSVLSWHADGDLSAWKNCSHTAYKEIVSFEFQQTDWHLRPHRGNLLTFPNHLQNTDTNTLSSCLIGLLFCSYSTVIIITSDQSNLTTCHITAKLLHTDRSIVFARLCLCAKQCFLGPSQVHIPNCISISSADSTYILQWAAPSPPLKIVYFHWWSGPHVIHCSLGPTAFLIGSAIFAGLTTATDWATDHATRSVTTGCIYVHSTAIWPNNNNWNDIYVAVIIARRCHSSPSSFDECSGWPPTHRPNKPTWAVSPPVSCHHPHPSSPFIITHPESW